jgi:hypothetical protein
MGRFAKLIGLESEAPTPKAASKPAPKKPAPAPKVEEPKDEPAVEAEVSADEE